MYYINMEKTDMDKYRQIGGRIQKAREAAGLTQEQLARSVGYQSATAISFIEAGERKLRAEELEKIAVELHSDVNYLLTGKTDKKITVKMALRAEHNNLSNDSIKKIESFIDFVKKEQDGRRSSNS